MTAADLLGRLQARGVALRVVDGDRLRLRPAHAVSAEELAELRRLKPEVMRLLTRSAAGRAGGAEALPALLPSTLAEVCGPSLGAHAVASIAWDVREAVRALRAGIAAGQLPPRPLVAGRPLADWLPLEALAGLLRDGGAP